ncbi:MAG TPA: L,D-transpeptidase family protein [Steroidobacteraceae bacterium]
MKSTAVLALIALLPSGMLPAIARSADAPEADAVLAALAQPRDATAEATTPWRDAGNEHARLARIYGLRGNALLWSHDGVPTPNAVALLHTLSDAASDGLQPADYQGDEFAAAMHSLQQQRGATPAQWASLDLQLSEALLDFTTELHCGRVSARAAGFELPYDCSGFDAGAAVVQLATLPDTTAALAALEPPYIHYRLLKQALPRFRQLATQPELSRLPPLPRARVAPGQSYAGVPALRRLLVALDCLPREDPAKPLAAKASDAPVLDRELSAGLQRCQALFGLKADGQLGRDTFAALTVPLAQRVRQIELTLERWRWLPPLKYPSIIVNIPQFHLFALDAQQEHEDLMLQMDVIVGQEFPRTQTPVFMAAMKSVVFRPYWDVPRSILTREILPAIRLRANYLEAERLQLVRGESDDSLVVPTTPENVQALADGRLRLRQLPGPDNSLGLVKFLLPNPHDVYLHSTPAAQLFREPRRTFSHGCIRVSDPAALAQWVLKGNPGEWTTERVGTAMQGEDDVHVALAKPVQVLIVYGTALATEDGAVHFFDDIYGHDRQLEQRLGLSSITAQH